MKTSKRVCYEDFIVIGPYTKKELDLRTKKIVDEWGELFPGDNDPNKKGALRGPTIRIDIEKVKFYEI
jgi:hypothetical protein